MKFLNQENNPVYKLYNGGIYYYDSDHCLYHINDKTKLKPNEYDNVFFYPSGILIKRYIDDNYQISFYDNNIQLLLNITIDNLSDDMYTNTIKVLPCQTGLLYIHDYFNKNHNKYKYITYNNLIIEGKDLDSLVKRINEYEINLGIINNDLFGYKRKIEDLKKELHLNTIKKR